MSGFTDADHQNQMAYSNWPPSKEIIQNHGIDKNELSGPNYQQSYQNTAPSEINYIRPSYCNAYQNLEATKEADAGSSHLSFLYDRAQGPLDKPQTSVNSYDRAQAPCDKIPSSANSFPLSSNYSYPNPMNHMTNGEDDLQNSTSSGLINRAIPAKPSYSHSPVSAPVPVLVQTNGSNNQSYQTPVPVLVQTNGSNNQSYQTPVPVLVQTNGSINQSHQNEGSPGQNGSNNEQRQQEQMKNTSHFHQMPEVTRQMSNLNTSDLRQSGHNGNGAGQSPHQNGHVVGQSPDQNGQEPRQSPRQNGYHNGGGVEKQRIASESDSHTNRKPWSYSPQFGNTTDPKNITRQRSTSKSNPIPDYLSFRKMSVPLVATRPKVQIADYSSDDQLADHSEMRSLQRASSEVDHSSVHQLLREGDEIGVYHQKSIRYTGKTNPSKIFKLLQAATGSEGQLLDASAQSAAKLPPRRRVRKQEPVEKEENNADDVIDISYVGGNIPSRTFHNLREAMGETDNPDLTPPTMQVSESTPLEQVRSVRVIHLRPRKSIDNGITDF